MLLFFTLLPRFMAEELPRSSKNSTLVLIEDAVQSEDVVDLIENAEQSGDVADLLRMPNRVRTSLWLLGL